MTFLLDVHLSRRLAALIKAKGHDAIHVLDILNRGRTKDTDIRRHADDYQFVLISKDKDCVTSHTFLRSPRKLIKINLGNLGNEELMSIFEKNWGSISTNIATAEFLMEIDRSGIVLHQPKI